MWPIEFIKKIFVRRNHKDYFQAQSILAQMIDIECVNSKCPAHDAPFKFDESRVGAGPAKGNMKTETFIIRCPVCGTLNKVFLSKAKEPEVSYGMGFRSIKRPPRQDQDSNFVDVAF
jgi:hypothetical protein